MALEPPPEESAEAQDSLPLIEPGHTFASITDKISAIVLTSRTPRFWYVGFGLSFILVLVLLYCIAALVAVGVGLFGIMIPVAWGFAIVNFVWWIGIGHAGTLISAILLLLRQKWRQSINRFAEAMTLFAVACAGLFPLIHLGRPWFAYWLFPYPSTMGIQPQFRSPLVWDVFAVSTYFTVSLLFWFLGLIPDLATLRDRARGRVPRFIYGMLAMGWRGSAIHWYRYEMAYLLLAGLATPLVVSVKRKRVLKIPDCTSNQRASGGAGIVRRLDGMMMAWPACGVAPAPAGAARRSAVLSVMPSTAADATRSSWPAARPYAATTMAAVAAPNQN